MGGWPRGHRRSADIKEIGFSGPFFTPRREIAMRQQEMERRRQPASAAGKSGRLPSSPAHSPGRGSYQTRSGAVARPARRALAAGRMRHRARGLRLLRLPGREAISVWAATARVAGAAPGFTCHRAAPQETRDGRRAPAGRRAAAVPAYLAGAHRRAGMQGRAASLPRRDRLGAAAAGALPPVTVAIPGSPRPGVPPSRIGAGAYRSPCTSRVPAVTSQGPGRETAGQRRI